MTQSREPKSWRAFKFLVSPRSSRFLLPKLSRGAPASLASYALIGAVMALGGRGDLLDRYLGTKPSFVILGLSVGICVGFYNLVTAARRK
jgi:F0F1-type ATP synthase assembly protein I